MHREEAVTANEDANAVLVRRAYEAVAARDLQTMHSLFAEDAVWHFPGRSPIAGDYRGVDAIVRDFLARVVELSGGTLTAVATDILANDRHVVVLQHSTGQRKRRGLDVTVCQVFRIQDGKIVEVTPHYSDLYALDEFWSL